MTGWLEERARKRATDRLGLPADEAPLDFDVGKSLLAILPPPFPFPLPSGIRRVDLIVTERGLYVHAGGAFADYPFPEILWTKLDEDTQHGSTFRFRLTSGKEGQIIVGRFPRRDFYQTLANQLQSYEASLTDEQRAERRGRASELAAFDDLESDRRAILSRHEGLAGLDFTLGFKGDIIQPEGTRRGCQGGVTLELNGIQFYEGDHTRMVLTVPYELITDVAIEGAGKMILGRCRDGTTFEVVQSKVNASVEEFMGDLQDLMRTRLREA